MEPDREGQELTQLLRDAADERPGAAAAFFEVLIRSSVYIPLKPTGGGSGQSSELGQGEGAERFVMLEHEGERCIPIFSEEAFVQHWADQADYLSACKQFKTLLWLIDDETWLYLNPNQDVGKEITAWEVNLLRKGEDAVPELVSGVSGDPISEIEVRSDPELYANFKTKLLPILEVYAELEECFIAGIKEGGTAQEKPVVGLRWNGGNEGKRQYIKSEIEQAAEDLLPETGGAVLIIDDLEDPKSPNHAIFEDAVPIYFQKPFKKPTFWSRLSETLRERFGRKA